MALKQNLRTQIQTPYETREIVTALHLNDIGCWKFTSMQFYRQEYASCHYLFLKLWIHCLNLGLSKSMIFQDLINLKTTFHNPPSNKTRPPVPFAIPVISRLRYSLVSPLASIPSSFRNSISNSLLTSTSPLFSILKKSFTTNPDCRSTHTICLGR